MSDVPQHNKYSILIADDHGIVRHGLRLMIRTIEGDIFVDEAWKARVSSRN